MFRAFRRLRAALIALLLVLIGTTQGTVSVEQSLAVDADGYIQRAAVAARASQRTYGVPVSVTIAQSILESGWGRSQLTRKWNNYFGIKCSALRSPHQKGCKALPSAEYVGGRRGMYTSKFRTYTSMEKSFLDHGRLLDRADRYNKAFNHKTNPDKFIRAVHKAGYATDPRYSASVISLMRRYNLYRFDSRPQPSAQAKLVGSLSLTAQVIQQRYRVPASVLLAQAVHHSDAGRTAAARKARNLFGTTCAAKAHKGCVKLGSTWYRKYASLGASLSAHGKLLATDRRFAKARKLTGKPSAYLAAITKAGWSKRKGYAARVSALIGRYGLSTFDLKITLTLAKGDRSAKVAALQNLLTERGHRVSSTGYFGTLTHKGVKAFQKRLGLRVSGKADPVTLSRLVMEVRPGAQGAEVSALKALLRKQGLKPEKGNRYGARTRKAVVAFQKRTKLPQTAIVASRTWGKLFG